ncbi:sialate O-acetylesterase-like [Diadema setosum]|uniref:sialate O-acetylesterase-like n=1 Tax=Diadema setosum TaxID=31175 RepID=UPI003B3BDD9E
MVLQMEPSRAVVWGYADIGANVTLKLKGKRYPTIAGGAAFTTIGVWKITLDPQPPSGPFTIKVTSESDGVTEAINLQDVMFGDVWVCSGQSNMAFDVKQAFNGSVDLQQSYQYTDIRVMSVFQEDSPTPYYDLMKLYKPWSRPDPAVLGQGEPGFYFFSALCWLYGRNLYNHLKYPIGLVSSNWGGTPVEAWSSPSVLAKCNVTSDSANVLFKKGMRKEGLLGPHDDSGLWNAMIHPLINMTIKGAIWYQGEANAVNPSPYKCLFPGMIEDWRNKWYEGTGGQTDQSFPFGFVQLCTSEKPTTEPDQEFCAIRWHQTVDYGYVPNPSQPNVFMAVAIDLPDLSSPYGPIHPRYKQDVADRLTLGARSVAYGEEDVVFQGPFPSAVLRVSTSDIFVEFDDGKAILAARGTNGFDVCCSTAPANCPLAGIKAPWLEVETTLEVGTSYVLLEDPCIALGSRASAVRYIWRDMPCTYKNCQLYDARSGLPVPPFIKEIEDAYHLKWTPP